MTLPTALMMLLLSVVSTAHGYHRGTGFSEPRGSINIRRRFLQQMNGNIYDPTQSPVESPSSLDASNLSPSIVASADLNPPSQSSFVVELFEFTVLVKEVSYSNDLYDLIDTYLTLQLGQEFDSLLSVDLLQTSLVPGSNALTGIIFNSRATFDGSVSADQVREEQVKILQDSEALKEIAPDIDSISVFIPKFSPAGLIVVTIVSTMAFMAAIIFAYRQYRWKTTQLSQAGEVDRKSAGKEIGYNPAEEISTSTESDSAQEAARPRVRAEVADQVYTLDVDSTIDYDTDYDAIQSYPQEDMHGDEFSINIATVTDYDTDNDASQCIVINANNHNQSSQSQHRFLKAKESDSFYESDEDFTYCHVAKQGMDSDDDDLYTTENECTVEKVGFSSDGNSCMIKKKFFTILGSGADDDVDNFTEDEEWNPSQLPRLQTARPFNEMSIYSKSIQGNLRLNQHDCSLVGDDGDDDEDGDDEGDYPAHRKRLAKTAGSISSGKMELH